MLWLVVGVVEAKACGVWRMVDRERGVEVSFHASAVWVDGSTDLMGLAEVATSRRAEWVVDRGDRTAMDGTVMLRDGDIVGEWIGADRLRLGGDPDVYRFALAPTAGPHGRWYTLEVDHGGVRAIEAHATSVCGVPLAPDDEQREIRTRVAYYLAKTRDVGPLEASIPRLTASERGAPGTALPATLSADTELVEGSRSYSVAALGDGDPATPWCEGEPDLGVGATITLTLATPTDPVLRLSPGHQRDRARLVGNGQPRRVLVETDTGAAVEVALPYAGEVGGEPFAIPLRAPGTRRITLTLVEAWPGERWDDTCIAALTVEGASPAR